MRWCSIYFKCALDMLYCDDVVCALGVHGAEDRQLQSQFAIRSSTLPFDRVCLLLLCILFSMRVRQHSTNCVRTIWNHQFDLWITCKSKNTLSLVKRNSSARRWQRCADRSQLNWDVSRVKLFSMSLSSLTAARKCCLFQYWYLNAHYYRGLDMSPII